MAFSNDTFVKLVFDNARNWLICVALFGAGIYVLETARSSGLTFGGALLMIWGSLLWIANLFHGLRKVAEAIGQSASSSRIRFVAFMVFLFIYCLASLVLVIESVSWRQHG